MKIFSRMQSTVLLVGLVLVALFCIPSVAYAADSEGGSMSILVALIPAVLALLIAILREIVPKMPNTYDDMALAALSQIKPEHINHLKRLLDPHDPTGVRVPTNPTGRAEDGG